MPVPAFSPTEAQMHPLTPSFEKWQWYSRKIIKGIAPHISAEDLEDLTTDVFVQASQTWDPEKSGWMTWQKHVTNYRTWDWLRREAMMKRHREPLHHYEERKPRREVSAEALCEFREEIENAVRSLQAAGGTVNEIETMLLHTRGLNMSLIAASRGVNRQSAENALKKLNTRLKKKRERTNGHNDRCQDPGSEAGLRHPGD